MMPKGVEHSEGGFFSFRTLIVKIPMMPKGVEHKWPKNSETISLR